MTNTAAPPGGSGGSVLPPANPQPPQRVRRTHTSAGVSNALKALPKSLKKKKNESIAERNGEWGLLRAQHAADATAFPDDASMITVSDDEDFLSPASTLHKAVMASSPKTGKILLRALQSHKRSREDDDSAMSQPKVPAKKPRVEVAMLRGQSLPIAFHQSLHELYNNNIYMPLSMFTTLSLAHINANAVTMDTRKVNGATGEKPSRVLNTVIFEKDVLKETEMDRAQWTEAALNFVDFVGAVEGVESDIVKHWQAHFRHFSNAPDKQRNYPVLLSADITLRQCYVSLPFVYNHTLYNDETRKGVTEIEVDERIKELMASGAAAPDPVYTGGGGRGRGGGRDGGGGVRGGAPPFRVATTVHPRPLYASSMLEGAISSKNVRQPLSPTAPRP
ncbi:hypothetical protein DFH07DRAFT_990076 [Mycena maculata]|uniref:Uncharacterized protein n=1 Tax=Mycena maculata TaxID=230809 RepID=A0AAD7NT65_9AGAR|nr:hypothetical protein DFH07DRAFT_990076 [Mycena maculata]